MFLNIKQNIGIIQTFYKLKMSLNFSTALIKHLNP
jgi:hypothetical protein